jgi:hypothetical protein
MMSGTRHCAALLLFLSLACAGGGPDSRPVRVRVVLQPFLSHAPMLLADVEGFFSEQGLEVEFVRLADPVAGVPMLLDGGVDVLAGSASPGLLNAMASGQRVRAVAEKGSFRPRACSQHGLLIRRALLDAASNGPPAVRRISLDKQPQQLYLVERMLASVGLRLDAMEQLFIPHLPEMTALVDGTRAVDHAQSRERHECNAVDPRGRCPARRSDLVPVFRAEAPRCGSGCRNALPHRVPQGCAPVRGRQDAA